MATLERLTSGSCSFPYPMDCVVSYESFRYLKLHNIESGYPCSNRLNVILTTHRDERTAGASLTISHSKQITSEKYIKGEKSYSVLLSCQGR